jgi:hypothetical protein
MDWNPPGFQKLVVIDPLLCMGTGGLSGNSAPGKSEIDSQSVLYSNYNLSKAVISCQALCSSSPGIRNENNGNSIYLTP